jgi:hypothetical protein
VIRRHFTTVCRKILTSPSALMFST